MDFIQVLQNFVAKMITSGMDAPLEMTISKRTADRITWELQNKSPYKIEFKNDDNGLPKIGRLMVLGIEFIVKD